MSNIDLSLVPAKDLADELMRRASCGVVMFKTLETDMVYFNWVGDFYGSLGLCTDLQNKIINNKEEMMEE